VNWLSETRFGDLFKMSYLALCFFFFFLFFSLFFFFLGGGGCGMYIVKIIILEYLCPEPMNNILCIAPENGSL